VISPGLDFLRHLEERRCAVEEVGERRRRRRGRSG